MDKPRKKGNTDAVQYQKCPNHVYLYIELNKWDSNTDLNVPVRNIVDSHHHLFKVYYVSNLCELLFLWSATWFLGRYFYLPH